MALIFFVILLAIYRAGTSRTPCDACFYGACFTKYVVLQRYEQIGQMAIDRNMNFLYMYIKSRLFCNTVVVVASPSAAYSLIKIPNINVSYAKAVDQATSDIYISDYASVFKTNPANDFRKKKVVVNGTVWHMQFQEKLYYCLINGHGIKYYEDGVHKDIDVLAKFEVVDFIVDNKNDIYFESEYSLYKLKHRGNKAIKLADEVYSLTTDKYGYAYFLHSFERTLYRINDRNELVEIGAFASGVPHKAVFTSENTIVYSDTDFHGTINHLVPNPGSCKLLSSPGSSPKTVVQIYY